MDNLVKTGLIQDVILKWHHFGIKDYGSLKDESAYH